MPHSLQIDRYGSPDEFQWRSADLPAPSPHEVRLRQTAIGLNYVDSYMRSGNHPAKLTFPAIIGTEGSGIIEAVGNATKGLSAGDRVAYFTALGAYTEARNVPGGALVRLPSNISHETAAAVLAKGLTARYLCRDAYTVSAQDTVLIHSAAGGVGTLLSQWCASLGAEVIGTVSNDAKAALAEQNGCKSVIRTSREDFVSRVAELTNGRKATVVFDALGADTALRSLDCLRPKGTVVCFGRTIDWPSAIEPGMLMRKGSLRLTMTQIVDFYTSPEAVQSGADEVFEALARGAIQANIRQRYALRDGAAAHRDLESRNTSGASVLLN